MHVHVPKPLHGWKAFFNEIFVIVIGVLIALGLEQVVEWVHWQHQVEEGEGRLRLELGAIYLAAVIRVSQSACVNGQYEALKTRIVESCDRLVPRPNFPMSGRLAFAQYKGMVISAGGRFMTPAIWEALKNDGTALHMPAKTQRRLGVLYNYVEMYREKGQPHPAVTMDRPLALDPAARMAMLTEVASTQRNYNESVNAAALIASGIRDLGYAPSPAAIDQLMRPYTEPMAGPCAKIGHPLVDWRKAVAAQPTYDQLGM